MNQLLVHIGIQDLRDGGLMITLCGCRNVHVPVIPTVASPKNIIGSRPCELLDGISIA